MINQVTLNSNNAIDMSRAELISWLNELLNTNLTKIEQLGSGVAYCYLIDLLYPGKIPINRVNAKAKSQYEFVGNFKMLQQAFTKLGIMKNIDIQKLIKCKYQDNLEFLQWFKKIFDSNIISGKDYHSMGKKTDEQSIHRKKEPSKQHLDASFHCQSFQTTERSEEAESIRMKSSALTNHHLETRERDDDDDKILDSPFVDSARQVWVRGQRKCCLWKLMMVQKLMQEWELNRGSGDLVEEIKNILDGRQLGEYMQKQGI